MQPAPVPIPAPTCGGFHSTDTPVRATNQARSASGSSFAASSSAATSAGRLGEGREALRPGTSTTGWHQSVGQTAGERPPAFPATAATPGCADDGSRTSSVAATAARTIDLNG